MHESREHRYYEKFKKQVEPNEDDETNSGRQGRKGSAELLRARSDRVRFEIFMTVVESRLRVKQRTSINSLSIFHKEKEMADFRKWFLAFAVVALLLGMGSTANAQIGLQTTALNCNANAEIGRAH